MTHHRVKPWQGTPRRNKRPKYSISGWVLHVICLTLAFSVCPVAAETNSTVVSPAVNLSFQDTEIRSVFTVLADLAGINVIFDPGLVGKVTVTLKNVSVQEAIATVARAANVTTTLSADLLVVGPRVAQAASTVEEPVVRVYSLQYAEPAKVVEIAGAILPTLKVTGEDTAKRVVARGTASDLVQFETFLAQFDKAGQQVLIEARVQEVSRDAMKDLGISWTLPAFNSKWDPVAGALPWSIDNLSIALDALEGAGEGRLLARPHLTAVSGEKATVFVGDRVPVVLKGGDGKDTIEYIEAGIALEIVARVGTDGMITTHVKPQVSSIASWTPQGMPQVRSRNAETTVRVRDGQPILIAGLIREEDRKNMSGITGLGNIPIVGALFRTAHNDTNQMETVIILTPRLVAEDGTGTGSLVSQNSATDLSAVNASQPQPSIIKSNTKVVPTFSLAADVTAANPGKAEFSLGIPRQPGQALELRVLAPLPADGNSIWRYGIAWRLDDDPIWFHVGAYGLVATNRTNIPIWEAQMAIGFTLARYKNLFVDPYAGVTLPFGPTSNDVSNTFGILTGFRL